MAKKRKRAAISGTNTLATVNQTAAGRSTSAAAWWQPLLAASLIVLAVVIAYSNSFDGAFLFDDLDSIPKNPTIRHIDQIATVLSPPTAAETVSGRPLLNLSLAINYALHETRVQGYHVANLVIHILAALLLFGILRQTLLLPSLHDRWGRASTWLAFAIAAVWALHPLQTEAVAYIVQRAESLVAMFYLLTLYCILRGAQSEYAQKSPLPWYAGAVTACLLGMAAKEVMVTAPVVALLYDRAFLTGSFRETLRQRGKLYLCLAATWGLSVYLVATTGLLNRRADFGAPDPWSYATTQPSIILHYLRLCGWPAGQCLDYRWPVAQSVGQILPGLIAIGTLGLVTLWGLVRNTAWAFLGACFFLILAPTSSIVPLADLAFEHRLYLPLAAVLTLFAVGGCRALESIADRRASRLSTVRLVQAGLALSICIVFGVLTYHRNMVYQTPQSLWEDAVEKAPYNARAHNNLGAILTEQGRFDEAIRICRRAVQLDPAYAGAYSNLGEAYRRQGNRAQAIVEFKEALKHNPESADAENNLGEAFREAGQLNEAIVHYRRAITAKPRTPEAYSNLGLVLGQQGNVAEEIASYEKALELQPDYAVARRNLGITFHEQGKIREAVAQWRELLGWHPEMVDVLRITAWTLATCSDASIRNGPEAVALSLRAVHLSGSRDVDVLDAAAAAYAEAGRYAEAQDLANRAVQLAISQNHAALASVISARLKLYAAGMPFHEPPRP